MELPRLEALYQQYRDRGFQVVAVEAQRDRERAVKFVTENKLTYPTLENGADDAEFVRKVFQVASFPTSFLVDGSGRVLAQHVGFAEGDEETFAREIERILSF